MAERTAVRAARPWGLATIVRRVVSVGLSIGAMVAVPAPAAADILFSRDTYVPRSVQEFAWRVIETRCNYQSYERQQRSFWAYDTSARRLDTGVVYSINVVSDLGWRKTEPPALIQMTVLDDGQVKLTGLKASFITCSP